MTCRAPGSESAQDGLSSTKMSLTTANIAFSLVTSLALSETELVKMTAEVWQRCDDHATMFEGEDHNVKESSAAVEASLNGDRDVNAAAGDRIKGGSDSEGAVMSLNEDFSAGGREGCRSGMVHAGERGG